MRYFGSFLCILRSNASLSLDELAKLVGTSRSTISRLENDEYPQPFKGSIRKLIIALAEILCTSKKETERLLNLAGIERTLLAAVAVFALYVGATIVATVAAERPLLREAMGYMLRAHPEAA